jgi:hypothetical protein
MVGICHFDNLTAEFGVRPSYQVIERFGDTGIGARTSLPQSGANKDRRFDCNRQQRASRYSAHRRWIAHLMAFLELDQTG